MAGLWPHLRRLERRRASDAELRLAHSAEHLARLKAGWGAGRGGWDPAVRFLLFFGAESRPHIERFFSSFFFFFAVGTAESRPHIEFQPSGISTGVVLQGPGPCNGGLIPSTKPRGGTRVFINWG